MGNSDPGGFQLGNAEIRVFQPSDQRLVILQEVDHIPVKRVPNFRKLVAVHVKPVIQRRCSADVLVYIKARVLQHGIAYRGAAHQMTAYLSHIVRLLSGVVVVYHCDILRFKPLNVALAVLAVNCQQKLRVVQLTDMLQRDTQLGDHQLHVALAYGVPAAVHQPYIFA